MGCHGHRVFDTRTYELPEVNSYWHAEICVFDLYSYLDLRSRIIITSCKENNENSNHVKFSWQKCSVNHFAFFPSDWGNFFSIQVTGTCEHDALFSSSSRENLFMGQVSTVKINKAFRYLFWASSWQRLLVGYEWVSFWQLITRHITLRWPSSSNHI